MAPRIGRIVTVAVALGLCGWRGPKAWADDTFRTPSKPVHEVKIEFDRRIPMRVGVTLSADV